MLPPWLVWSRAALLLGEQRKRRRRRRLMRRANAKLHGHCPICAADVTFLPADAGPRETPRCVECGSVPRHRALVSVLARIYADRKPLHVHESSPSACTAEYFRRHCAQFTGSYYLPHKRPGAKLGVFVNCDLGQQPFAANSFDLVITQDVLEHLPRPQPALREIERTLRPGGRHLFTVPRTPDQPTRARAEWRDGALHQLLPAEYHRDPTDQNGSLVVTDWGSDLESLVALPGRSQCTVHRVLAPQYGILTPVEVFELRTD
jgi:SAM-dependent methyltransferase